MQIMTSGGSGSGHGGSGLGGAGSGGGGGDVEQGGMGLAGHQPLHTPFAEQGEGMPSTQALQALQAQQGEEKAGISKQEAQSMMVVGYNVNNIIRGRDWGVGGWVAHSHARHCGTIHQQHTPAAHRLFLSCLGAHMPCFHTNTAFLEHLALDVIPEGSSLDRCVCVRGSMWVWVIYHNV